MDIRDSQRIKEIRDNTAKMADAFTRIADALECLADRKTESSSEKPNNCEDEQTETQTETQNSNLTFEKRKCINCNFLTYMFGKTWCNIKCENPHDKVCDRFKPKDEPQTDEPYEYEIKALHKDYVEPYVKIEDEPQTDCPWK